jgi:hypothetical protein
VLLVEIERRCPDAGCNARTRVGLTRDEASAYTAFTCERCERRWDDVLSESDVPEWWEDLKLTGLDGVRAKEVVGVEAGEVVERMSDAWRRAHEDGADVSEGGDGEDEG